VLGDVLAAADTMVESAVDGVVEPAVDAVAGAVVVAVASATVPAAPYDELLHAAAPVPNATDTSTAVTNLTAGA
jgi:hypothetical protein